MPPRTARLRGPNVCTSLTGLGGEGADGARLLYARTPLTSGDLEGAERELRILAARPLDGTTAPKVAGLLARAVQGSKASRGRITVFAGMRGESDPTLGVSDTGAAAVAVVGGTGYAARDLPGTGGGFAFARLSLRA